MNSPPPRIVKRQWESSILAEIIPPGWRRPPRCGNSRCLPRELLQGHSYKESVAPLQNRYRKIIHVSVPPQGKKEGKTLQQLHALYRKQGSSEESNKNPY